MVFRYSKREPNEVVDGKGVWKIRDCYHEDNPSISITHLPTGETIELISERIYKNEYIIKMVKCVDGEMPDYSNLGD